jgi:predicted ester cyclase
MSKEDNFAVQAMGGEIGETRDFDRFGEVFAENLVDHDHGEGAPPGVQGIKQWWRELAVAFPDFNLDVDVLMGYDEFVALSYRLSGTHQGEFLGFAPTGRHFEVRSLQLGKFSDGKIVERWGSTDILGILTQLGLVSLPQVAHAQTIGLDHRWTLPGRHPGIRRGGGVDRRLATPAPTDRPRRRASANVGGSPGAEQERELLEHVPVVDGSRGHGQGRDRP